MAPANAVLPAWQAEGEATVEAGRSVPEPERAPVLEQLAPFESSPWRLSEQDHAAGADGADVAAAPQAAAPAGGGGVVLAVVSGVSGPTGTFAATPLSVTGSWSASPGSGEFTYSYPIDLPRSASGSAPSVGMGYSSGAVDGLTGGANAQASQIGLGWNDFANGFIERSYEPCSVGEDSGGRFDTGDLCWKGYNGTISLNGVSGALIPLDSQYREWRVANDPGWKIERIGNPIDHPTWGSNEGEYWKVTAQDGTQYFFGQQWDPDTHEILNSFWWAPVLADHPGEPCYDASTCRTYPPQFQDHCKPLVGCSSMGWRWNLDRIVDPDGNVTVYHYGFEDNRYKAFNNPAESARAMYIRSGWLERIEYGRRSGTETAETAQVLFYAQNRCFFLEHENGVNCPDVRDEPNPTAAPTSYPDVPLDLLCNNVQATCPNIHTPSFFAAKRYSAVKTEVWDPTRPDGWSSPWKHVTQHNFYHAWSTGNPNNPNPADIDTKQLLTRAVTVGLSQLVPPTFGTPLPETTFAYEASGLRDNRVDFDTADPETKMRTHRLTRITNPYGGVTRVAYFQQRNCPATYLPPVTNGRVRWDLNVRDCFPQTVTNAGGITTGVFHKWLTREVVEEPRHGSDPITTTYTYGSAAPEDGPAWAFNAASFERHDHWWGWQVWRGYRTVMTTRGTTGSGFQKTKLRLFQGMYDDYELEQQGGLWVFVRRDDRTIPRLDGTNPVNDDLVLAGRTLEQQSLGTLGGQPDQPMQSTLYGYEVKDTTPDLPNQRYQPQWAGVEDITESLWSAPGLAPRQRGGHTEYNARGLPLSTEERGWFDLQGDERCTFTTYAESSTRWMWNYPASNRVVNGTCAAPGSEVSASETLYDNTTTVGAAPIRGNPTKQRTKIAADGSRWAESTTVFDALGRPTDVTDSLNGTTHTTFTATPAWAIPTEITVTNALGHQTRTKYLVNFGVPLEERDSNNKLTTYAYDAFGRRTAVRLPTEQGLSGDGTRSWHFVYHVDPNRSAAPKVHTRQLTSQATSGTGLRYEETWTVYDAMGRQRQVQTPSPVTGKTVVTTTAYDALGQVWEEMAPEAVTATPNGTNGLLQPATYQNRTRHYRDALGRPTRDVWLRGSTETARQTTTTYTPGSVTVIGATGSQVRETVDGLGRTVKVEELDGTNWVAANYVYDAADNLTSVFDAEGHETRYLYNLAGWRIVQNDPSRGAAWFDYDNAGNRILAVDGNLDSIHTIYDKLGRPTERHSGSTTGPLLASWSYDATNERGMLNSSTRRTSSGDWVTDVTGYDARNRPLGTTVRVPAGVPGLSEPSTHKDYTVTHEYDRADRVVKTTYPAVGGLSSEEVTTGYSDQGLPNTLTGASPYVRGVTYDDRGRQTNMVVGPQAAGAPNGVWMAVNTHYNDDQVVDRVENASSSITSGSLTTVAGHDLIYDDAGKITERTTTLHSGGSWRECYGYDTRNRLTQVKTIGVAAACTTGGLVSSYAYSPGNRVTEQNRLGVVSNYSYPAAGQARPYAPVTVGGISYEWDNNGNLTERTEGGETETFDWDVEQQLTSVDDPDGDTSFVYDAGGQRLLRRTSQGATLYFAGHEVTANASGSSVTAVRSYSFGDRIVATRTSGGVDYLMTDDRGSVELAAPSGQAPTTFRAYEPYGLASIHNGDQLDTDRGFLSQFEDDSTGLSYLNARYYDTETTQFTAPDPMYSTKEIKSLNPYTYGHANPVSKGDASGTSPVMLHNQAMLIGQLTFQNALLNAHIGFLNSKIDELQGIIRDQADAINQLLTHIGTLEATIRQQQTIIRELADRVVYLERQVAYWKGQAQYWYRQAMYWKGQAAYWYGKAMYYRNVAFQLVDLAYLPQFRNYVKGYIDSGRGLPNLWLGTYQAQSMALQDQLGRSNMTIAALGATMRTSTGEALSARGAAERQLYEDLAAGAELDRVWGIADDAIAELEVYREAYDPNRMNTGEKICWYNSGGQTHSPDNSWSDNLIGLEWQMVQWTPIGSLISNVCYAGSSSW